MTRNSDLFEFAASVARAQAEAAKLKRPPLFDIAEGKAQAEEGIRRADAYADKEWKVAALEAVKAVANANGRFTANEVWEELAKGGASTAEPRALGAIFRKARKLGWIQPTNEYLPSKIPQQHRRPIRVWESLPVFGGLSSL